MKLTPISFEEMIANLVREGAVSIKIERAQASVGCFDKGDIIALLVTHLDGSVFIASLCNILEEPVIEVEKMTRDCDGRFTDRYTIKRYLYVH